MQMSLKLSSLLINLFLQYFNQSPKTNLFLNTIIIASSVWPCTAFEKNAKKDNFT